jgi:hypothetical protein
MNIKPDTDTNVLALNLFKHFQALLIRLLGLKYTYMMFGGNGSF